MLQAVILLCGVPASGKTWVLSQLGDKFTQVHNDNYIGHHKSHVAGVVHAAAERDKPVIVDCPFGEREFKETLEQLGLEVYPFFIVEDPMTIAVRYLNREGKNVEKNVLTRAKSISNRADEWNAPRGTSSEILQHLSELMVTRA